jgi:enoyl-CoA hydratase
MNEWKSIGVTVADGVAEVVLVGPGKGNAMGPDFWREMPLAFDALERDANVRAILVRGSGGHFSYGLDLVGMGATLGAMFGGPQTAKARRELLALVGEMQRACDRVATCAKPSIAAITGWCIGGGLDLAAACDVRLCSADARFSLREVKVGMVADIGSLQRLPAIIGEGNTRELAFTGKNVDAARALRMNLVGEVYETEAALLDAARAMAREIADNSGFVVQGIKSVMNEAIADRTARGLRHVALWNAAFLQSADLGEAIAAFLEKRKPAFKGE